ncbi:hypothetical protein N9E32_02100 [Alphaproteobacteria bacterium]|nr:hypothetical protein [Alphaproteobacteria bacterium]
MKLKKTYYNFISLISLLLIFFFSFLIYKFFLKSDPTIINFYNNELSSDFEMEITNNLENLDNFFENFTFINNYLVNRKNYEIDINIQIKEPFAKNLINEEIIFTDNTLASFKFFTPSFINSIDLEDISNNSIQINNYLRQSLLEISNLFKVSQIEYVDGRRYNLYLVNGQLIMLPKKITKDLLVFIKQNYEILKNNTNFQEYLDLRNFHEKTIRAK